MSRKIKWVSSVIPSNELESLELSLADFYSNSKQYFSSINFTENNWINNEEKGYLKIVEIAKNSQSICEIGCGGSNILAHYPELKSKYTGLDFSKNQLEANALKYSGATFNCFTHPNQFPVDSLKFDFVFSVFVLEHVTRPADFLNECKRILKPNGILVILCPDFLGKGRMTSQRAGLSEGTTKDKIKKRKFIDALVTLYDNRVRIPLHSKICSYKALKKPRFFINLLPTVFTDSFMPDVDAVYLTYKPEISTYLKNGFNEINNNQELIDYEIRKKIIFLQLQKIGI